VYCTCKTLHHNYKDVLLFSIRAIHIAHILELISYWIVLVCQQSLLNLTTFISESLQELLGNKSLNNYDEIAHEIAYYEKSLAQVCYQCINYIVSHLGVIQFWLTNTEERNYTLRYNPMSLEKLSELFPLVGDRQKCDIVTTVILLGRIG